MLGEVFGNSKRGIRIIYPYYRAKREKNSYFNDKKGIANYEVQKCLWKKYHNSGSYNDLCEYKRVLNRATSKYKEARIVLKKKNQQI